MTNLEIRKAALEATGWYCGKGGWWYGPQGARCEDVEYLPAVESDPAAFWPWFLKWCEENEISFDLDRDHYDDQGMRFCIGLRKRKAIMEVGRASAATIELAGCMVVIAAVEGGK